MKPLPRRFPVDSALILLLFTAFFTPIFGGYIVSEAGSLAPGLGSALAAALGGSDAPVLTHGILCLPMFAGILLVLTRRRVQQVPKQLFTSIWLVFFLFLGFSTFFSSYRALSLTIWLEWLCYGCSMFAAVSIGGRKLGPLLISSAVAAGSSVVAVKSILEYGAARANDPSWRVFGGWMNPNATAAILLIGLFVSLGLCLSQSRTASLVAAIGAIITAFAMVLTGSKGAVSLSLPIALIGFGLFQVKAPKLFVAVSILSGLLAMAIGAMFVKNVGWVGIGIGSIFTLGILAGVSKDKNAALRTAGILVSAGVLMLLLGFTTRIKKGSSARPATPIARVGSGAQTQEQSSDFRLNLWKSAGYLIKQKPVTGYGLGSYRNESARSGITTTTVLAHSVYLQLWAEAGFVPFALFVFGMGLWLRSVFRSRSTLPTSNTYLLGGIVGAVFGILSHSLVDSDLYYFGIGVTFFILLGLGLSLSSDSVAPELVHKPIRIFSMVATVGLAILLLIFAAADDAKAIARQDLQTGDSNAFRADADNLSWFAPFDGEAMYLQALGQPPPQSIPLLQQAYELNPTDKIARYLATDESNQGKTAEAESVLKVALDRDPSNYHTLSLLMKIQQASGDSEGAIETAKRLVAVESTPYFKVRSIPESIPTETYDARINVLAPAATDEREKARYLSEAVRGYLAYADMRLHILKSNAAQKDNDRDFRLPGYDSLNEADKKLAMAVEAAKEAIEIYRKLGDKPDEAEMEVDRSTLAAALAG